MMTLMTTNVGKWGKGKTPVGIHDAMVITNAESECWYMHTVWDQVIIGDSRNFTVFDKRNEFVYKSSVLDTVDQV